MDLDVITVGGGLGGSTLASAVARSGLASSAIYWRLAVAKCPSSTSISWAGRPSTPLQDTGRCRNPRDPVGRDGRLEQRDPTLRRNA